MRRPAGHLQTLYEEHTRRDQEARLQTDMLEHMTHLQLDSHTQPQNLTLARYMPPQAIISHNHTDAQPQLPSTPSPTNTTHTDAEPWPPLVQRAALTAPPRELSSWFGGSPPPLPPRSERPLAARVPRQGGRMYPGTTAQSKTRRGLESAMRLQDRWLGLSKARGTSRQAIGKKSRSQQRRMREKLASIEPAEALAASLGGGLRL